MASAVNQAFRASASNFPCDDESSRLLSEATLGSSVLHIWRVSMVMSRSAVQVVRAEERSLLGGGFLDHAALADAYGFHGPELRRFARRYLGDDLAAQDAVQEVFLRAWRAADSFEPELASLRVWLFAIARNVLFDELRRSSRRPVLVPVSVESLSPPNPGFDERILDSWLVEEALRRIADDHRYAIVQIYLCGRPYAKVAADLKIPIGTLRSRLFYGLRSLRSALSAMGVDYLNGSAFWRFEASASSLGAFPSIHIS